MRRPSSLPTAPEPEAPREAEPAEEARIPEPAPVAGDIAEHGLETDAVEAAGAPAVPEVTSARDVWRAARARRKALRAEIRRFTKSSRRRRTAWLAGIGAVVALVAGSAAVAYSPLFAVERITVVGTSALDASAVEAALAGQLGTPLALVDDSAVKAALTSFPLIETYALEARPPHDLTVRIVERTPVGVIESGAGYTLVDAAGVALSTTPSRPDGQPLLEIDGGPDSAAFTASGLVIRSVPADIRSELTAVSASSGEDVTLRLASGTTVVWGGAEESATKAIVLEQSMQAHPGASRYDVSSPEAVVVG